MNESQKDRVTSFKLLGLVISSTMKWDNHVVSICFKTASRLHFLKILRKACINQSDALCFCTTVIRPILEYACHSMLTEKLTFAIVSQQIRAMRIIFSDIKYEEALELAGISTLQDRRENLTKKFFLSICHPDSCLYYLLPAPRDNEIVSRLRTFKNIQFLTVKQGDSKCLSCNIL